MRLRNFGKVLGLAVPPPFVGGGPGRVESSKGPGARQGGGACIALSLRLRKVACALKPLEDSLFIEL